MKQKVLIVGSGCPSCEAVKEFLTKEGTISNVKIVDITTPEGSDFAKLLGVDGVPECAIIEGEGEEMRVRVCTDEEWKSLLVEKGDDRGKR